MSAPETCGPTFSAPTYRLVTGAEMAHTELATGFTPLLLIAFLTTTIWLALTRWTNRGPEATIALALSLACIVIAFLALKTGDRAHWEPFFSYVPGARALRVPMRFLLFITPVVIMVAIFGISRLRPVWAAIILLLVAAEQYRPQTVRAGPDRRDGSSHQHPLATCRMPKLLCLGAAPGTNRQSGYRCVLHSWRGRHADR